MRKVRCPDAANLVLGCSKSLAKSIVAFKEVDLNGYTMSLVDIGQNARIFRIVALIRNRLEQPCRATVDFRNPNQLEICSIERLTHSL